ncbi:DUF4314 domain-containing protein [Actinomadura sp. SCN-SB]|uniref:DUF4314 domain-containing protein n=1 Tax=Actinomadura sp. SCN-SB TaxID=3373092 RepID=UPI00375018AC
MPAGRLAQLFLGVLRVQPPHGNDRSNQSNQPGDPDQSAASADAPAGDSRQERRAAAAGAGAAAGAQPGSRIRLISTSDPYTDLRPGALGTVTGIDDLGTLAVRWDDGHTLGLIPGLDQFDIL